MKSITARYLDTPIHSYNNSVRSLSRLQPVSHWAMKKSRSYLRLLVTTERWGIVCLNQSSETQSAHCNNSQRGCSSKSAYNCRSWRNAIHFHFASATVCVISGDWMALVIRHINIILLALLMDTSRLRDSRSVPGCSDSSLTWQGMTCEGWRDHGLDWSGNGWTMTTNGEVDRIPQAAG